MKKMKTIIKIFGFFAISAIIFSGCSKSDDVQLNETFTHTIKINASQPLTKTSIIEGETSASYKWSSDDANRFVVKENNVKGTGVALTLSSDDMKMTLSATFETVTAEEYVYSAFLAKTVSGSDNPKVPATQTCTSSSYDPDADVIVAAPMTFTEVQDELSMNFMRPAVINKMTLKGLGDYAGETISTVKISADKNITGTYTYASNPENPSWTGDSKTITVNVNQSIPSSGEVVVFFVSMPVSGATLKVEATSDNHVFTKEFTRTINFTQGLFTIFGVTNLTAEEKVDYSGTYVLANAAENKIAAAWANGNNLPAIDVKKEGDILYYDPDAVNLDAAKVTLARIEDEESEYYSMYTMKQNNLYLYAAGSGNNYLKGETEADVNAYWEVSNTGAWSVVATKSTNNNTLQYNASGISLAMLPQLRLPYHLLM